MGSLCHFPPFRSSEGIDKTQQEAVIYFRFIHITLYKYEQLQLSGNYCNSAGGVDNILYVISALLSKTFVSIALSCSPYVIRQPNLVERIIL